MNPADHDQPHTTAAWYELRVQGHLDQRWATRFDPMTLTTEDGGTTCITGPVTDQAALQGLLRQISDLGLSLVSVARVEPTNQPPNSTPTPHTPRRHHDHHSHPRQAELDAGPDGSHAQDRPRRG